MKMTNEGLALIQRFEGLRTSAYLDAVGVWTIGYGHTSMAREPNDPVRPGQRITKAEAERLLREDVGVFASGVAALIRKNISPDQFSALVSFAYNVGLGGFRKSSVLAAVNSGRFDLVPSRLNLWTKAGGRVLPGLVKRRAAEGALFSHGGSLGVGSFFAAPTADDFGEMDEARGLGVFPVDGKAITTSRTAWASVTGWLSTVAASFAAFGEYVKAQGQEAMGWFWTLREYIPDNLVPWLVGLLIIGTLASAWIIYDRHRKSTQEGV